MIKKWEVRITKIINSKEVLHGIHYFDVEKDAKTFYAKWKPSTRLVSFRVRLICITERVDNMRETQSIASRLKKTPKP